MVGGRGFAESSTASLLLHLHGDVLQDLSGAVDQHVMGIAQGVRKCRGRLCSRIAKRLHQLDTVAASTRHTIAAGCRDFAAQ
eukprot:1801561-Prorocentrum_lima.AAC.1